MKLYVPTNGDKLKLVADWTFTVYNVGYDDRNETLLHRADVKKVERQSEWDPRHTVVDYPRKSTVTLPANTVLQVDRVYIRKFNSASKSIDDDYDSITFQVIEHPTWPRDGKRKVMARFWVKLRDANSIEFEHAAPPRWSEEREDA